MEEVNSVGHRALMGQRCCLGMTTEEVAPYETVQDTLTWEVVWFPGCVWAARDMTRGLPPLTRPTSLTLMRNKHWLMEGG